MLRLKFATNTEQDELRAIRCGRSLPGDIGELYRDTSLLHWLWPCVFCEQLTSKLACFPSDRSKTLFVCAGCLLQPAKDLRLWRSKNLI